MLNGFETASENTGGFLVPCDGLEHEDGPHDDADEHRQDQNQTEDINALLTFAGGQSLDFHVFLLPEHFLLFSSLLRVAWEVLQGHLLVATT